MTAASSAARAVFDQAKEAQDEQRLEDAVALYETLSRDHGAVDDPKVRSLVAGGRLNQGAALMGLERYSEACRFLRVSGR
jgi:hypothetical protein